MSGQSPRTAFVFSGIGTQWAGMAQDLLDRNAAFTAGLQEFDAAFSALSGWSVAELLRDNKPEHKQEPAREIALSHNGHPCVIAVQFGICRLLEAAGVNPDCIIGHSGGEVVAAWYAGRLNTEDTARVVYEHSRLLEKLSGSGGLAHINLPFADLKPFLSADCGLVCSVVNSPDAVVVGGDKAALEELIDTVTVETGVFCRLLRVDVPFHTPALEPHLGNLKNALSGLTPTEGKRPIYSTVTGELADANAYDAAYWCRHIREPVLFAKAMAAALDDGITAFIEISPHAVLMDSMRLCATAAGVTMLGVSTMCRDEAAEATVQDALRTLERAGVELAAGAVSGAAGGGEASTEFSAILALPERRRLAALTMLLCRCIEEISEGAIVPDAETTFANMGLTSLLAVKFKQRIETILGMELIATVVFNHPNVSALATYILQECGSTAQAEVGDTPTSAARLDSSEPIAVIGVGCRFPGEASTPEKYWNLLAAGVDAVSEVPADRWDVDKYYDPDPDVLGKMYVREGGFLQEPIDLFDAQFFGISAREARQLDPQQRMMLEVIWEAFENAGVNTDTLRGSPTGCYLGIASNDYSHAHRDSYDRDRIDAYSLTGTTFSASSGRPAYFFGLEGPCFAVDTACSSTAVALHLAVRSLRSGESSLSVVSGVNLMLVPDIHIAFTRLGAVSPDGRSKAYDDSADGYGRGEGCAAVILKRLSDAERDGDKILGLIRGTAINQDGRSNGLTAPNGLAQEKVIKAALTDAGVAATEVSYVEGHGTGTALGDSIELDALTAVYCKNRPQENPLRIGSAKANIGHLEACSALAGVIKVMGIFQHRQIPANIHVKTPNTHFAWERHPIIAPVELTDWQQTDQPRLAGLSAFGFSGTNGHLIMQEYVPAKDGMAENKTKWTGGYVLPLSAKSPVSLEQMGVRYHEFLKNLPEEKLLDAMYTAGIGRTPLEWRATVFGKNKAELLTALRGLSSPAAPVAATDIAMVFTGQGSQYPGMGRALYEKYPAFREALDHCDEILRAQDFSLLTALYEKDDASLLAQTETAQPVIAAVEYALFKLWTAWGLRPVAVCGHSIGEYPAAVAAGILSVEDMLTLVLARGRCMAEAPHGGGMIAVFATRERVEALLPTDGEVTIAAVNAPESLTLSGSESGLQKVLEIFAAESIRTKPLKVSNAFHSAVMLSAREKFREILAGVTFHKPQHCDFISSVSGQVIDDEVCDPSYWAEQIVEPVLFAEAVNTLSELCAAFLEVGGAPALSGLIRQSVAPEVAIVSSLSPKEDADTTILRALGKIWEAGGTVAWEKLYAPCVAKKIILPNYPFERQRYWMPVQTDPLAGGAGETGQVIGALLDSPALQGAAVFETEFNDDGPAFLHEHIILGRAISPAAGHIAMLYAAARELWGDPCCELSDLEFLLPLLVLEGERRKVQIVIAAPTEEISPFRLVSRRVGDAGSQWLTHCTGQIARGLPQLPEGKVDPLDSAHQTRFPTKASSEEFYGEFIAAGYELAEGFCRIEDISIGKSEALCRVRTRSGKPAEAGHVIYPGAVDSILQSSIPSFLHDYMKEMMDGKMLLIPMHMDYARLFQADIPEEVYCFARVKRIDNTLIRGYSLAVDKHGKPILELEGSLMRKTDRETLYRQLNADTGELLYAPTWQREDSAALRGVPTGGVVVQSGSGELAGQLAKHLGAELLTAGNFKDAPEILTRAMTEQAASSPVIFVQEHAAVDDLAAGEVDDCAALLALWQRLIEDNKDVRGWLVTTGTEAVTTGETPLLRGSSLRGFGRTIAVEQPTVWGGIIDLDAEPTEKSLELLAAIVAGKGAGVLGAIRDGVYYAENLSRVKNIDAQKEVAIQPDASYLISGGTGALGGHALRWLVEQGAGCVAVMGRRAASSELQAEITKLTQESSSQVIYVQADVADLVGLGEVISLFGADLPPLKGIFHAAGLLDDRMLSEQSPELLGRVMLPKIRGALNLHELTIACELDMFVMYSSAATLLGSKGQANYAAANQWLNGLARHRRASGLAASSICWGPWQAGGMADEGRSNRLAGQGILSITPERAMTALALVLQTEQPVCGVMAMDWKLFANAPTVYRHGYFGLLMRDEWFADAADNVKGAVKEKYLATDAAAREEFLSAYLRAISCAVLGFQNSSQIRSDQPLMEQGFDSLMAVDIRNRMCNDLALSLSASILFDYPTLEKIAGYLEEEILREVDGADASVTAPETARPEAGAASEGVGDLLEDIDSLLAE